MELPDRIRAYVAAMPPAVSGQDGHNATFAVASVLVHGFALSQDAARPYLDEYNLRCMPPWSDRELAHKLRSAEKSPSERGHGYLLNARDNRADVQAGPTVKPAPKNERPRAEWAKPDMTAIDKFTAGLPDIDTDWLRRRSPVDVATVTSGSFLEALYGADEKVIIFTRYFSQGDFIWWVGRGGFRLSDERGTKAAASELPRTAKLGVWYLVQPVSGRWEVGERVKEDVAKYTRRSEINVTRWVYFVLESDDLDAAVWSRVLAGLRLPIAAIYSSGGRSMHALVRYEVSCKAEWDLAKHHIERLVCPLGADPGALSAVRLSRLPGCLREGKETEFTTAEGKRGKKYERYPRPRLQELFYLNPNPVFEPIFAMQEVRR